jgi:protein-tyrosine phosphatase
MKESDWKLFRKRVPEWRERYLRLKNKEIVGVLTTRDKTPTEQFWAAKEKIEEEAKILVHCLDGHSRSKMQFYLFLMYRYGLIEDNDLEEFSKELREQVSRAFER